MSDLTEADLQALASAIAEAQACGHCDGSCEACQEELAALAPVIARIAIGERTLQYGVCTVWADPVKAGAAKTPEEYEPTWLSFDTEVQADSLASKYRCRIGDMMPWYQGPDVDDIWQDSAVLRVDRATRWAVERYGPWEPSSE